MTFFEQELRKIFDHDKVFPGTRFIGNACYGRLTDDIRVKVCFVTGRIADNYDALKVTLLNRKEGPIDSMTLPFGDLWGVKKGNNSNIQEGISPHIWNYNGKVEWYAYQPKQADYKQLADTVRTYVEVFQEPVLDRKMAQTMG